MSRKIKHLLQDVVIICISIAFAVFVVEVGLAHQIVDALDGYKWVGIFVAGLFFTSVFTTAPSIAILATFAATTPLPLLVILGGLGAMTGDYVIFRFVKDRMAADFDYLFSLSKLDRFSAIFHNKIFRFFVPFVGALIIASPFPDEIGITMLGLSHVKSRVFFAISFLANSVGILMIGIIAQAIYSL